MPPFEPDGFYQRNIGNGELGKHWKAYAAAAVIGYVLLSATCGPLHCEPLEAQKKVSPFEQSLAVEQSYLR